MLQKLSHNLYVVQSGALHNNTYVLVANKSAIVIDPSFASKTVLQFCQAHQINELAILITHYHNDHVGETSVLLANYLEATVYVHAHEVNHYYINAHSGQALLALMRDFQARVCLLNNWDQKLVLFNQTIHLHHTPIHTMGSITYQHTNHFFTGDFLFSNEIGYFYTKLKTINQLVQPLALFQQSVNLLTKHVNDSSWICPGHNAIVSWQQLLQTNQELHTYWTKTNLE